MTRQITAILLVGFLLTAEAQQTGETVIVSQAIGDDLYAAGRHVELRAPLDGDAVLAGETVRIMGPVTQDVIAAGETVIIGAKVGDDVRAAGRAVRVEADVAGHLVAAGAEVEVAQGSRIGSFAWLAGNDVSVAGDIGGGLKVRGESVRIGGHVAGDADISARHLELLPGARIDGKLSWHGQAPRIADGATVGGPITGRPAKPEHRDRKMAAGVGLIVIAAFAAAGLVLYLLFPAAAAGTSAAIRQRPAITAGLGFAVLFLTPFVIILLFATVIGWLLALILLALYLTALGVGSLVGTYAVTDMALARAHRENAGRAMRAMAFFIAIVVVGLLQGVPILGSLVSLLLLLWGLGAILWLTYHPATKGATA